MNGPALQRPSYDELHYVGKAYAQTHPDHLAALGRLHGMRPAPVENCRVLELACGDGTNLLPMAYSLPGSKFYGIDLAAKPLELGVQRAAALGLINVTLEARDVMDFPAEAGEFDYIIAHGFYSWCPPAVSDRLLAVCRAHLAPQGIAFVSFNAYPGYHAKDLQRQLMLYHLAQNSAGSAAEEISEALGALAFVARVQPGDSHYRAMLTEAHTFYEGHLFERGGAGPAWFQHDMLSPYNSPAYFHQFMSHAHGHGLHYVCDTSLRVPRVMNLPPEALKMLAAVQHDIIAQEQYLDFILCASFRQVLLCRDDAVLIRTLGPESMRGLGVAGKMQSESAVPDTAGQTPETFATPRGKLSVAHPSAKETLRQIGAAWPGAVAFETLLARRDGNDAPADLSEFILRLCVGKFVRFRVRAQASAAQISRQPEGSAFARMQARESATVTTLYHRQTWLAPTERFLLGWLDGSRDRAALLGALRGWIASGQAVEAYRQAVEGSASPGEEVPSPPSLATLEADLDAALRTLLEHGLLLR